MNRYEFRKLEQEEASSFFELILARIRWMDEKGIRLWNVLEYDKAYPLSFYEEEADAGNLYGIVEKDSGILHAGAVLYEDDEQWDDDAPALYIHNFASDVSVPGSGRLFLRYVTEYAVKRGKEYLRLDSSIDDEALGNYYSRLGFTACGTCEDGPYRGIRREKPLKLKVYFAASIRGGRDDADLYAEFIDYIKKTDTVLTEHIGTSDINLKEQELSVEQWIYERDTAWLRQCDVLIAECTSPSLGVGYELAYAEKLGKPCYIFYRPDKAQLSAMLKGDPYYTIYPYKTKEELFEKTEQVLMALKK